MTSAPPALLLGGGVVAISVARGLHRHGVPVIALGHRSDPVRRSRARRQFVDTGAGAGVQERWLSFLEGGPRSGAVLPCSDDGLELLARNRRRLTELGYAPMEGDDDVVLAMLDKQRTAEIARAAGVDVPRTATVERDVDPGPALRGFSFPCALKPRQSHLFARHFGMRRKLIVVESRRQLEEELEALPDGLEMIATEIVPGPDRYTSYYSYLDPRGEPLFQYTKQKLRQWPIHFGMGSFHRSDWNAETAESGLRFLRSAGVRGPACVEFKRDERDGRLKLIECNHRFTAADALLRACGLEIGWLAYRRALGLPHEPPGDYRRGVGLWAPAEDFRALSAYRRAGELTTGAWLRSLAPPLRLPVLSLADPLPSLVAAARLPARALRKLPRGRRKRRAPATRVEPRASSRG